MNAKVSFAVVTTALVIGIGAASLALAQQKVTGGTLTAADYVEIQQLVSRYGYAVDTHADNGYAYADLFTVDGMFGKTKGRDALAELREIHAEGQRWTCVHAPLPHERDHLPHA